jgi:predicted murein hydrolase (TIGR00659 family)
MNAASLLQHPSISIAITLAVYWLSLRLHSRFAWAHPLIVSCGILMVFLWKAHVPYATYRVGGDVISWFLGPGTVALAVPMYRHSYRLRSSLGVLALIVLVGSAVGMTTAALTAYLFGAPRPVVMAAIPKSVTTPIAIEVSRQLHGLPEITVAMVIVTGILGSIVGPLVLRWLSVKDDRVIGVAIGTSSHAVGTASLIRHSELQASVSSWAMAAAGIFTAILASLISLFIR